jgi:hypothetical protein
MEAKKLYEQYQELYGNSPTLDQAVRLTSHCVETGFNDGEVKQRAKEAVADCEVIASMAYEAANKRNVHASYDKARLIDDIVVYLEGALRR